ncbi:spore germination protein [Paenibacillus eucommiae]|uniref:Spore germination protein KA n=1 Tax=Paenibacillus eucommiae TaxID=1355755 RepID=A0ABS4IXW2_9BACL|nr:spore germination protein [Paenibacillus eucommiae]MBP1992419.1 spore germination protein KA [Paenibacillus eucommiae]
MSESKSELFFQSSLADKVSYLSSKMGHSSDLVSRILFIGESRQIQAAIIFVAGLIDSKVIGNAIESLLENKYAQEFKANDWFQDDLPDLLQYISLPVGGIRNLYEISSLFEAMLSGEAILVFDGHTGCLALNTKGGEERSIEEPSTQTVVRGPREGFTENLNTNTALVRRKIKNENLWLEKKIIGTVTKTDVALMYIEGIADKKVVEEARIRLDRIDIDGILESGYIEEMIQDETYTPFPTIMNSERPDVVAAALLEGRIAIFIDGTPFVLLIPALFIQFFQAAEDYYQRYDYGIIRLLRFLTFFIALLGPAMYIAITTFHQETLPTPLLISLAAQREGIPFPAFVEALIMEVTFEILREAGVRMPRAVGQAVSIVGALVLGDAAVQAGLVSPAMVIVVSLTALSNLVIPAFNLAISIRVLRFAIMLLAASFGLFGISAALIGIVLHLCSLRSFGVPFMSPFAPFIWNEQRDTLIRLPIWMMHTRPRFIGKKNKVREHNSAPKKPSPS